MTEHETRVESILERSLDPSLKAEGFERRKRGFTWVARRGELYRDVVVSIRRVPGYDYFGLGIGIGIGFLDLAEFLATAPSRTGLDRTRRNPVVIGGLLRRLVANVESPEWLIDPDASDAALAEDIRSVLLTSGQDCWRRFSDLDDAVAEWQMSRETRHLFARDANSDFYLPGALQVQGKGGQALEAVERSIQTYKEQYAKTSTPSWFNGMRRREIFREFLLALS